MTIECEGASVGRGTFLAVINRMLRVVRKPILTLLLIVTTMQNAWAKTIDKTIEELIEERFDLVVLSGGHDTPLGRTINWTSAELQLIFQGLENLEMAVGRENSHLWNSGGTIARVGTKTVSRQFGAVHPDSPRTINVVIDVSKEENFPPTLIAQRIAHESAHIWDLILGEGECFWSETRAAKIFEMCRVSAKKGRNLYSCLDEHPTWFNFHPTRFVANDAAEFYGKMVEEWVREKQGLTPVGRYRQQDMTTEILWDEMVSRFSLK